MRQPQRPVSHTGQMGGQRMLQRAACAKDTLASSPLFPPLGSSSARRSQRQTAHGSLALRVHANSPARPFFPDHPEPPASALVSLSPKSCHVSEQFSASELMVLIPSENYPVTSLALAASLSPKPITSRRQVLYLSCPPRAHC